MSIFQTACVQPSFSLARRLFVLSPRAYAKQIFLRVILQSKIHCLVGLAIQICLSSLVCSELDEVSQFHGKSFPVRVS